MTIAVDTSVAVPLLVRSHQHHTDVARWWGGQQLTLSGHALAETYSVLTRLPGDARLSGPDAARLLDARFTAPLVLSGPPAQQIHTTLSRLGIVGGAVYDGLVALTAKEHGLALATRDARARGTYDAVGVKVILVG
ncbi:Predicted nucleic acid-binding protein, contains PIN domain [Parafrankia irregularis]|uniref:Ribonuclease VapC n=1 Tax=Parafrankia irregularis TaxID=795642 RepID=A0A0S4QHH0_9ACTN|nr:MULTISPECIES: type II toxin-antitoxin system VapC family toxin [Frankiaceae]EFC80502.1 PilT protein domain protein [Parafrankia sp. EUN1f]KPM50927.1 ribonuclease [Frankia sp. R43]MBE3204073.1 type II toxin-antitoxin system VapC family toxin [Parafrankia sp. CH37]CUU55051.1 Predicted nucleic acid-binding protein, contains PIN domain [Parafrankia irregularis]